MFMFNQENGKTRLYVPVDGAIAISVRDTPNGMIATIYSTAEFKKFHLLEIVTEVKNG